MSILSRFFDNFQGLLGILMVIPNDFGTLIDYFSFSMWIFHESTCAALLYFRYKLPTYPRPIKVKLLLET